jgi:hypothetical protein
MHKFQIKTAEWLKKCFSPEVAADKKERSLRFIEEAVELVQSTGLTEDDVLKIVYYVYNRDTGFLNQEIGGVMVTLAGLCEAENEQLQTCALVELMRVNANIEKIREKQLLKKAAGITT